MTAHKPISFVQCLIDAIIREYPGKVRVPWRERPLKTNSSGCKTTFDDG